MATSDMDDNGMRAPRHPVPQLQGPFEESMLESVNDTIDNGTKADPVARRTMLLEKSTYERICAGRWKQKPGEKYHPLWKITAQMSFGIHLLVEGLAKSEEEVMKILQTHVDDVDGFLESTTEDFDLAQSDVEERLRYLKLPLEHVEVFDKMLEDRTFRVSIVEGNEKIEHIVERTSEQMKDTLKDAQKGLQATNALGKYLQDVNQTWVARTPEHDAVFVAMVGNVEGWHRAFMDLHMQGNRLGKALVELAGIVEEMQRRAGVASRRTLLKPLLPQHQSARQSPQLQSQRPTPNRSISQPQSAMSQNGSPQMVSKALPTAPDRLKPVKHDAQQERSRHTSNKATPRFHTPTKSRHEESQDRRQAFTDRMRALRSQKSAPDMKQKGKLVNGVVMRSVRSGNRSIVMSESARGSLVPQVEEAQEVPAVPSMYLQDNSSHPVELPAEVPDPESLEKAKSLRKRLSSTFAPQVKDESSSNSTDSRRSSLGNMLKLPGTPRAPQSPRGSLHAKQISPPLPTGTVPPIPGYFDAAGNMSAGVASPDSELPAPLMPTPLSTKSDKSPRVDRSAFNPLASHPPDMKMAISPPLRRAENEDRSTTPLQVPAAQAVPDLSTSNTSYESSLGEPGPEVSDNQSLHHEPRQPFIAELESMPIKPAPVEMEAAVPAITPAPVELEAPLAHADGRRLSMPPVTIGMTGASIKDQSDFFKMPPQQRSSSDQLGKSMSNISAPSGDAAKDHDPHFVRSFRLPPADSGVSAPGNASQISLVTASMCEDPSRSAVSLVKPIEGEETSVEEPQTILIPPIEPQPDLAKPEEATSPQDSGDLLPSQLARKQVNKSRQLSQRNSLKARPDLLREMSNTPPESPIHERHLSKSSDESNTNSSKLASVRASRDLAPPEEAPPPPGPGGRQMAQPDYAAMGVFEGERKPKRASGISSNTIKKIFSPGSSRASKAGSTHVVEQPEGRRSGADTPGSVDLMTAGGNDVLWFDGGKTFKGMSKEGVWA